MGKLVQKPLKAVLPPSFMKAVLPPSFIWQIGTGFVSAGACVY